MKHYRLTFDQLSGNGVRVSGGPLFPIPEDTLWAYQYAIVAAVTDAIRRLEPGIDFVPSADPDSAGRLAYAISVLGGGDSARCLEIVLGRPRRQCTLFAPLDGSIAVIEMCAWAIARALEPDGSPAPHIHDPETYTCRPNPEAAGRKLSEFQIPFEVPAQ